MLSFRDDAITQTETRHTSLYAISKIFGIPENNVIIQ